MKTKILISIICLPIFLFFLFSYHNNLDKNYYEWKEASSRFDSKEITYDFFSTRIIEARYPKTIYLLYFKETREPFIIYQLYDFLKDSSFTMNYYTFQNKKCVLNIIAEYNDKKIEVYSNIPMNATVHDNWAKANCSDKL